MARVWVTADIRVNLLPRCQINMPKVSARILGQVMRYCAEVERGYAPVATGALRNSITVYQQGAEHGLVRAGEGLPRPYAPYQEYGTMYNAPHPYARPAADDTVGQLNQIGNIEAELLA
jgi:hypothetical protein